jgi:gas vesicle protein
MTKEKERNMKRTSEKIAVGAAIAAAAGYVAGILTAPKSGKATRKDIQQAASKARLDAEHRLKELHSELNELIDQGRDATGKLEDKAKKQLSGVIDTAKAAKEKAREMLSAVHEGDAEDKDLQASIDDVTKAITHLKKFLKNDKKAAKADK